MARRVLPSRLELKRPRRVGERGALGEGQLHDAPCRSRRCRGSRRAPRPERPRHFHSSTTSGSACWMSARTRASVSPRQSPSSRDPRVDQLGGDPSTARSSSRPRGHPHIRSPGNRLACFTQSAKLRFVERLVLVDVEVAHLLLLRRAGRRRAQRRAAEEGHLDVLREAVEAEEPALVPRRRRTASSTSPPCARRARCAR